MNLVRKSFAGKKVLVTGHTGFKGAWLSEWLIQMGAEVAGFSKDIPTDPALFDAIDLKSRLKHDWRKNILDPDALSEAFGLFKPEVVFHLAAQPLVRLSYEIPKETFETNVMGTLNVLEAVKRSPGVKAAVFIATDKCYLNQEWEFGYRETDSLGGKDPYSASKAASEIVFSAYAQSFFGNAPQKIASARAGNVIGGGDWALDRLIPDAVRSWTSGKALPIRNPDSTRPWQHVLEPLGGYLRLASALIENEANINLASFNFGPPVEASQKVSFVIDQLQTHWNGKTPGWQHERVETEKKEAKLLKLICDRAWERLRWKPALSLNESLQMTAEWYSAYYQDSKKALSLSHKQIAAYTEICRERLGIEF